MLHQNLTDDDIRIIQAMADFQMALSAVAFLCELDENEPLSRVERRRYRCFEDAAIIAYWRPFSNSKGLPSLSLSKLQIKPTVAQLDLHNRIKLHRDKVIAHTDVDRMRLAFSTSKLSVDRDIMLPRFDFDDGLVFFAERKEMIEWLRTMLDAAARIIFEKVQLLPSVKFVRDHLSQSDDQG